jgi:hypothetical protein
MDDNPIKAAMDGWEELKSAYGTLARSHEMLVDEHNNLASRYDVLKIEYDKLTKERDLFQTYAIGLRTRLLVIKESILTAEKETMDWVSKEIEAKRNGDQKDDPNLPKEPSEA